MAKIDKAKLTRTEIFMTASRMFLANGYSNTSIRAISNELEMSTGNVTFYFPTKEHILAELIETLCSFQGKLLDEEESEGYSSIMGICLELATMAAASDIDENIFDIFYSAYTSPMTLDIIRKNDIERAKKIFGSYCEGWSDQDFTLAEILVSGIEFAVLATRNNDLSLEARIKGAIKLILKTYNLPDDIINKKIEKVIAIDCYGLGKRILDDYKRFVEKTNEHQIEQIVHTI